MTKALARTLRTAALLGVMVCVTCAKPKVSVQGVELSVTRIERMDLWQGGWAPPEHEFLVLHVNVDARQVPDQIALASFHLVAKDGSRWTTPTRELLLSGGAEHEPELGFSVPKGARPEALIVADVALDLASADLR